MFAKNPRLILTYCRVPPEIARAASAGIGAETSSVGGSSDGGVMKPGDWPVSPRGIFYPVSHSGERYVKPRIIACVHREFAEGARAELRDNPVEGVVHEAELTDLLASRGVHDLEYALALPAFHRLVVEDEDVFGALLRLTAHFAASETTRVYGAIFEPDRTLNVPSMPSSLIGLPFDLTSVDCKHGQFLEALGVVDGAGRRSTGSLTGRDVTVAIIDSGADASSLADDVADFRDIIDKHGSALDSSGHGNAMVNIVRDVAPQARVCAVRVFATGGPSLFDTIHGIVLALCDFSPDIISLSLGFPNLEGGCSICGSRTLSRSASFKYLFDSIEAAADSGRKPDPIFVAATGNENRNVYYPATYENDAILAVGSISSQRERSSFSNYGKSSGRFAVLPGGEWDIAAGRPIEWVGEGRDEHGKKTYCVGTSPATAYAAGIMALYSERHYGERASKVIGHALGNCKQDLTPHYDKLEHGAGRLIFH